MHLPSSLPWSGHGKWLLIMVSPICTTLCFVAIITTTGPLSPSSLCLPTCKSSEGDTSGKMPQIRTQYIKFGKPSFLFHLSATPVTPPPERPQPQVFVTYLDSIFSSRYYRNGWFPKKSKFFLGSLGQKTIFGPFWGYFSFWAIFGPFLGRFWAVFLGVACCAS